MSTKKYRLAAPINKENISISYQLVPIRLTILNNDKLNRRSIPVNNRKIIQKVTSKSSPRWWLVLPCVLLITLTGASDPLLLNDLIIRRYERYHGLSTSTAAQHAACRQSVTTPAPSFPLLYWQYPPHNQNSFQPQPDYNLVQRDAANFNVKNSIATLIPAVVTFLLLGSNSDIIGRRPLLVLPFLGKVVRYSLLLIIVSRDLSDAWLICTHALEACFGAGGLVMLSALAYITDCTNETRTRAFFITEVLTVIARIIPVLAISLWLRQHLYIVPLSVNLVLSVIGLFYALLIQPESVESVKNISFIRQLSYIRVKPIKHIITVFIVRRSDSKRQRIILITIVTILLLFTVFGYHSIFLLYLYGYPFCLDAFHVGLLSLAQAITIFVISFVLMLCKKTLNDTYILPILGSIAFIVSLVLFSVAKKIWLLYIAVGIGSLFFVTLPILRTKVTKLVEVNEYAIIFIGAGIVETIGHQAIGALANDIYKASLQFFPGLVFLIFAIIGTCPIVIMSYLAFADARMSKNTKKNAAMSNLAEHSHSSS